MCTRNWFIWQKCACTCARVRAIPRTTQSYAKQYIFPENRVPHQPDPAIQSDIPQPFPVYGHKTISGRVWVVLGTKKSLRSVFRLPGKINIFTITAHYMHNYAKCARYACTCACTFLPRCAWMRMHTPLQLHAPCARGVHDLVVDHWHWENIFYVKCTPKLLIYLKCTFKCWVSTVRMSKAAPKAVPPGCCGRLLRPKMVAPAEASLRGGHHFRWLS